MDLSALERDIREAFPTERQGDFSIVVHNCDECARVEADFGEIAWDEVPPQTIEYHYSSLPLLSPEAYQYFLPAYLLHAIRHPGSTVVDYLLYSLRMRWPEEQSAFTPNQKAVVDQVTAWIEESYPWLKDWLK